MEGYEGLSTDAILNRMREHARAAREGRATGWNERNLRWLFETLDERLSHGVHDLPTTWRT